MEIKKPYNEEVKNSPAPENKLTREFDVNNHAAQAASKDINTFTVESTSRDGINSRDLNNGMRAIAETTVQSTTGIRQL